MGAGDRGRGQGFWRRLGRGFRRVVDGLDALDFVVHLVTAPFRFAAKVLDVFW